MTNIDQAECTEVRSLTNEEIDAVGGGCPNGGMPMVIAVAAMAAAKAVVDTIVERNIVRPGPVVPQQD